MSARESADSAPGAVEQRAPDSAPTPRRDSALPDGLDRDGRLVRIAGDALINFASASYLGLAERASVRAGEESAVRRYGALLGGVRLREECPLYAELTERLCTLSGGYALITPSPAIGHMAAFPSLMGEGDALVIDTGAHPSLHTASMLLDGVTIEVVPHGDALAMEAALLRHSRRHRRVWYVCDGVYAMHGELAPFDLLEALLGALPNLHVYVDDSQATSWTGLHGRGLALSRLSARERVVVALSLAESFGASGAALVFGCAALRERVRSDAEPMLLSGAVHPAMLGAALTAAELHLAPAFAALQECLDARIALARALAEELAVPLAAADHTPMFFVPVGATVATLTVLQQLRRQGMLAAAGVFPAVPLDRAGIRFTVSVHTTIDDVASLIASLAEALSRAGVARPSYVRSLAPREGPSGAFGSGQR